LSNKQKDQLQRSGTVERTRPVDTSSGPNSGMLNVLKSIQDIHGVSK
jgi:hypothetical protein